MIAPEHLKPMEAVELLERTAPSDAVANATDESAYTLNITGVRLQGAASKAQLDSIPVKRKRPVASLASSSSMNLRAEQGSTTSQTRQILHSQRRDTYFHGGFNE